MTLGPVMLDIEGCDLTDEDRRRLRHPQTGGVILFSRNYRDPQQLAGLCREIHELRDPRLLTPDCHRPTPIAPGATELHRLRQSFFCRANTQ